MALYWTTTGADFDLMVLIAERAERLLGAKRARLIMDLTMVHANGCPLRLDALLEAPLSDFAHDIAGITRHLNRHTGTLGDLFTPRYAK